MEHDDISLDTKPTNRQNAGRYGNKTNKTIKYNPAAVYDHRKGAETIVEVIPTQREAWEAAFRGSNTSVAVSLNANKNWEWVEKQAAHQDGHNSLRRSQDDFEVDYTTRVAVMQLGERTGGSKKQDNYYKTYGTPNKTEPEEEKIVQVSGENRKGFFVKEKRRRGKKGVKRDTLSPNSNNRRPRSRSDAGIESSSSDEESGEQLGQQVERLLVVEKKDRKLDLSKCRNRSGCKCSMCTYGEKNVDGKRRAELKIMDLDTL